MDHLCSRPLALFRLSVWKEVRPKFAEFTFHAIGCIEARIGLKGLRFLYSPERLLAAILYRPGAAFARVCVQCLSEVGL